MKTDRLYRALRAFIVFLAGMFVMACGGTNPEPETKPEIAVDASCQDVFSSGLRVEAEPQGGIFTKDILFTTTDKWTATITGEGASGWISVRPSSGTAGKATMTVSVTTNEAESERRAEVTITCGTVRRSFTVMQEGKAPPANAAPVVLNYSDPSSSGVSVISFEDGVFVVSTTADKVPKVGDHICSGPTEQAPYGYLRRVVSVSEVETRSDLGTIIRILTDEPIIEQVFEAITFDESIPINLSEVEISSVTDSDGNELEVIKEGDGWKVIDHPFKIDLSMEFEGVDEDGKVYTYEKSLEDAVTIHPTLILKPKKLAFPISIDKGNFKRFGVETDWDVDLKVKTTYRIGQKYDSKQIPLFNVVLEPIPVTIGEVPLVFTPLITFYCRFKAEGGVEISFTPIDLVMGIHAGSYYDFETKNISPYGGEKNVEITRVDSDSFDRDKSLQAEYESVDIKLSGELRGDVGVSYSVGLYGCNLINRMKQGSFFARKLGWTLADVLAIDICGFLFAQLKSRFEIGDIEKELSKVKDDCSFGLYANFSVQFFCKLLNIGLQPKIEPKTPVTIWEPFKEIKSLFISDFSSLTLSTNHDVLTLAAKKHRPLFGYHLFSENDFGFCYKEMGDEIEGLHYYSVKDKYGVGADFNSEGNVVKGEIPLSLFEPGKAYTVYPYSDISNQLLQGLCVLRSGKSFRYRADGSLSDINLEDVPGEDL